MEDILCWVGLGCFGWFVTDFICRLLYPTFPYILDYFGFRKDLRRMAGADWAVVTGASDGIGKAYAKALSSRGFNLLLISRNPLKLTAAKEEIREYSAGAVEIRSLAFDFSTADLDDWEPVKDALAAIRPGILINNVGVSYGCISEFGELREDRLRDVIVVNCLASALMIRLVVGGMKQRKAGVIVNVSSASGFNPTPYLAAYSSTKQFLRHLSESLDWEYSQYGITTQCTFPFFVATKMSGVREPSLLSPDPLDYADSAIRTIGWSSLTNGWFPHALQLLAFRFLPLFMTTRITTHLLESVRRKWGRKRSPPLTPDLNGNSIAHPQCRASKIVD